MQSIDFNLIISNARDQRNAESGFISLSDVHRVQISNVFWLPGNTCSLISESMRQRLGLEIDDVPPRHLPGSSLNDIVPTTHIYRRCETTFISINPVTFKLIAWGHPILIPELPVDFVLGTFYFNRFYLVWNARLNRMLTRAQDEEEKVEHARRQTYRNIL
ncbi:hypothetical protein I4U23_021640 [Adineta vaga]|nr:hypothetical protein I4U23_021640 [Adineta vaga]